MCIAVVKPKFVDFPTYEQFENCFNNNPDGAGFMYSDGENLIIKKGLMSFDEFIKSFEAENISKDKLVFFHFRIATHGNIDKGNTHPFPLSVDIKEQRTYQLKYKGYGLIHNGIIHYDKEEFLKYDPQGVISDTMLFAMKLKERLINSKNIFDLESAIIYNILHRNDIEYFNLINECIGYNKVAIMNEKEEYVKYGKWIEENGVFYSNDDYKYSYTNWWNNYLYPCAICQEMNPYEITYATTIGDCCQNCCQLFKFKKCKSCGIYIATEDDNGTDYCDDCANCDLIGCDICHNIVEDFMVTSEGQLVCKNCYQEHF